MELAQAIEHLKAGVVLKDSRGSDYAWYKTEKGVVMYAGEYRFTSGSYCYGYTLEKHPELLESFIDDAQGDVVIGAVDYDDANGSSHVFAVGGKVRRYGTVVIDIDWEITSIHEVVPSIDMIHYILVCFKRLENGRYIQKMFTMDAVYVTALPEWLPLENSPYKGYTIEPIEDIEESA